MAGAARGAARLARLSGRLRVVPDVRHYEAMAGARDRAAGRGRSRHHARRCRGGALRYPPAVDRRRSVRCSTLKPSRSPKRFWLAVPGAQLASRDGRILHRRARRGGADRDRRLLRRGRPQLRDLFERGEDRAARRRRPRRSRRMVRSAPRPARRWRAARLPAPRSISRCRSPASPDPAAAPRKSRSASSISASRSKDGAARVERRIFPGDRAEIRNAALVLALELLQDEARPD